jgi:outer membrane protein assembly factor BamB
MGTSALVLGIVIAIAQGQAPAEEEMLSRIGLSGESARTARRLQSIDKAIAEKKWPDAVDELVRTMAEAGDDLVPVDVRHCLQARRLCQLRLARLPPEALRLYRGRVDSQAKKWLEEGATSRDPAVLQRLVDECFCSQFSEQALDLLGNLAFERGAFDEAEHWWQMLAVPASRADSGPAVKDTLVFPDPHLDVARVRAKQLLAQLFRGAPDFALELQDFEARHGTAAGHLAGRDSNFVDILKRLAAHADTLAGPPALDAWLSFAGAASRSFVLPEASGRLRRMPQLNGLEWTVKLGELREKTLEESELLAGDARLLPFYPVIVKERVFVANARSVKGYDLFSREPVQPVFQYDAPAGINESDLDLQVPIKDLMSSLSYTLTARDDRLYARLGAQHIGSPNSSEVPSYLVCLNLQTTLGSVERWQVKTPDGLHAAFEGAPVVHNGRVYAAVTRLAAGQTQTAILCLDADRGVVRWQRDVCETQELSGKEKRYRHHLLTAAGSSVFYCSHSGAIVALDAESGRRLWAVRYPSRGLNTEEGLPSRRGLAPCVYAAGRLYVAPLDYGRLLCLDADTGHVLWERSLETVHLLGVAGGKLFLNTVTSTGTGIPLQHNLRALDAATGAPVWHKPDDGQSGLATIGRGLLAGHRVYWPTSQRLIVLDQETGDLIASDKRIQGNLAAADGCLVATGKTKMTVYLPEE